MSIEQPQILKTNYKTCFLERCMDCEI